MCLVKMYESYVNSINSTKKQNLCLELYIYCTFHHKQNISEWKNEVEIKYNNQHKNKEGYQPISASEAHSNIVLVEPEQLIREKAVLDELINKGQNMNSTKKALEEKLL